MTKTKQFNVYNQRLKSSWSPSGRGKTHLKSVSEFHRKNIWDGRGHEQFGVVKSAESTQTVNHITGDAPPKGQDYYSVRVYIPKVNGYFSQPKESQKQLIEALLPEFIGQNEGGSPIPGQQARVSFVDPKNISLKHNNGKFLGINGEGVVAGAGSKIVPCAQTPVVRPPTGGGLPGKTPPVKQPAKKAGTSGGAGQSGLTRPPSSAVPAAAATSPDLGFTVCDSNYAVGDFITAQEAVAASRKNIKDDKKIKPRFPTAPAFSFGSKFGPRTHPITGVAGKMHWGVDIRCPMHTPVLAALPGKVISTNTTDPSTGYGLWVKLKHPSFGNIRTMYAHLNNVLVKKGDMVDFGTQIGISGNTGRSTGPHLHFELRQPSAESGKSEKYKDPEKFLNMSLDKNVRWEDIA